MRTTPTAIHPSLSSLTLGGGGLGQVWGRTTRGEAVATVRAAVEAGVTLLDTAPMYGRGNRESEKVIGEAFDGAIPDGVRVLTKCLLGTPGSAAEADDAVRASLRKSLAAMRLRRVDVLVLHSQIAADDWEPPPHLKVMPSLLTRWSAYVGGWIPAVERLKAEGLIGAWGITGTGPPETTIRALRHRPRPHAVQAVANCLDALGGMKVFAGAPRPRDVIAAAAEEGVAVLGIRAVAAGALCDTVDRALADDVPEKVDWYKARRFRAAAKRAGAPTALLAHRYALSMPGVDSVVLGVKNRAELAECVEAARLGSLATAEVAAVDAACAQAKL